MSKTQPLVILLTIFLLIGAGQVQAIDIAERVGVASSPNPVGSGARAVGMGGAFIAVADDATAASWNPAGLVQLEKPEASMALDHQTRAEAFKSSTNPEIKNRSTVNESNLNYLSVSYPFTIANKNMVVAINYQRLYDFRREVDYRLRLEIPPPISAVTDEHRVYERDGSLSALGLAWAVEFTPKISLGFTLNVWSDDLAWDNGWEEKYTAHQRTTTGASITIQDTAISETYTGFSGVNANIGLLWAINRHLSVGAVLKTPFRASLDYELKQEITQRDDTGTLIADDKIDITDAIELDMPMSYGLGVSYRFSDQFSVGLDIYRTQWSRFILTDGSGNKTNAVSGVPKNESNVEDTTQFRLGGEFLILKPGRSLVIPLRAGLFYDPEPSENDAKEFYGLTLGSGVYLNHTLLDLAYQLRWGQDVEMNNLIANSRADVRQHAVLVSLIYHF